MSHRRVVVRSIAGLAIVVVVSACGGKVDGSATAAGGAPAPSTSDAAPAPTEVTSEPVPADTTTETSESVAEPVTRQVDKTGWYDGFAITVGEVTAEQDFGDTVAMTVNFSYQNLGTDEARPPEASIEIGDETSQDGFFDTPTIPAQAKSSGTLTFGVTADPDKPATFAELIDQVTLVYGDAADNQTKIPLAADAEVDSVEPITLTSTGTMSQGEITIELVSGTLVPSYESGEKGKSLLNLRVKLTCAPGCSASGYNTGVEEFSVTGPDGNSVVADSRSEYCCDALYPETVSDSERNILTFVVASPGTGAYTLTYSNPNLTAAGTAPATLELTA